jgi:hypothetical protein
MAKCSGANRIQHRQVQTTLSEWGNPTVTRTKGIAPKCPRTPVSANGNRMVRETPQESTATAESGIRPMCSLHLDQRQLWHQMPKGHEQLYWHPWESNVNTENDNHGARSNLQAEWCKC